MPRFARLAISAASAFLLSSAMHAERASSRNLSPEASSSDRRSTPRRRRACPALHQPEWRPGSSSAR